MVKLGRPRSNGYEEFGFTLVKEKNKFVAICKICNRTLQNTAFIRLRGHRNICKPPSAVSIPQCSMFVPDDEIFCVPNQDEFGFPDGSSQISSDGFMNGSNTILQDSGAVEGDGTNLPSPYESDQVPPLQERKTSTNLKKVAVLDVIKQNKHTLFENPEADKSEVWIKVLHKAQSLGLASEDSHWTFARDSLYEMWKNRTLAKKDYLEADGWNDKLDIVDLAILKILGRKPPVSSTIDLSDLNSDCSVEESQQTNAIFERIPGKKRKYTTDSSELKICSQKRKTKSTQLSDELQKAELKIKRLKCEVLEIEVYKQRLQVLQLERDLKLPPSAVTGKLFTDVLETPDKMVISEEPEAAAIKCETEG